MQSDKVLMTFYELSKIKNSKPKFSPEDIAVAVWRRYPTEFSLHGYKDHPDVNRIWRVISKLLSEKYVSGNVHGYKITQKGLEYVESLPRLKNKEQAVKIAENSETARQIKKEIERIMSSRVYRDFVNSKASRTDLELLESDLFQFLGTTTRSVIDNGGKPFRVRYETINSELIPFCRKSEAVDINARLIVELWKGLSSKFGVKIRGWLSGS